MDEKGISVADALALRNSGTSNNGFGTDGSCWWVIILILFLGMGRGGWGYGNGNEGTNTVVVPASVTSSVGGYGPCCTPATQQGLTDAFNFNQLDNGNRSLERGLCDGFYTTNLAITNLGTQLSNMFCANDKSNLQGFNNVSAQMANGFNAITSGIDRVGCTVKDCCCETRESIMQSNFNNLTGFNTIQNQICTMNSDLSRGQENIKYALAQSTNEILVNNEKNTDRIINFLTQREIDSLRTELQSAQFQLSQNLQTKNLIDQLQPCAKPAYVVGVANTTYPYTSFGVNSCNCNTCA